MILTTISPVRFVSNIPGDAWKKPKKFLIVNAWGLDKLLVTVVGGGESKSNHPLFTLVELDIVSCFNACHTKL